MEQNNEQLNKEVNRLTEENLSLYRKVAGFELEAKLFNERLIAANKARNATDEELARLKSKKNIDTAVKLFEEIIAEVPDAYLKASENNPVYQITKEELIKFITQLKEQA